MGKVEPSITFAVGVGVLQNCNVWMADSGATTHSTPHGHGIVNGRDANDSEKVTMEGSTFPMLISPVISNAGAVLANSPEGSTSSLLHSAYARVTFHIHFACGSYSVFADLVRDFEVVTHWEICLVSSWAFSMIFWDLLVGAHSEFWCTLR